MLKLVLDITGKTMTVSMASTPKVDEKGTQKSERGTGRMLWSTQVFVLDGENGGEVITITTAGEKPDVKVGQPVTVSGLEAIPWVTNGRNGVAFRALELRSLSAVPAVK